MHGSEEWLAWKGSGVGSAQKFLGGARPELVNPSTRVQSNEQTGRLPWKGGAGSWQYDCATEVIQSHRYYGPRRLLDTCRTLGGSLVASWQGCTHRLAVCRVPCRRMRRRAPTPLGRLLMIVLVLLCVLHTT